MKTLTCALMMGVLIQQTSFALEDEIITTATSSSSLGLTTASIAIGEGSLLLMASAAAFIIGEGLMTTSLVDSQDSDKTKSLNKTATEVAKNQEDKKTNETKENESANEVKKFSYRYHPQHIREKAYVEDARQFLVENDSDLREAFTFDHKGVIEILASSFGVEKKNLLAFRMMYSGNRNKLETFLNGEETTIDDTLTFFTHIFLEMKRIPELRVHANNLVKNGELLYSQGKL